MLEQEALGTLEGIIRQLFLLGQQQFVAFRRQFHRLMGFDQEKLVGSLHRFERTQVEYR